MSARLPLAALAVTLGLLAAGCGDSGDPDQAGDTSTASPTGGTSTSSSSSGTPTDGSPSSASSPAASSGGAATAVYDLGTTPMGPRLFREFRSTSAGDLADALEQLTATPEDPDYRTAWAAGSLSDAHLADGQIDVTVDAAMVPAADGMSTQEATLAVQQVVYTLQAAAQQRLPVRFLSGDAPAATVLGVPTSDPVKAGKPLDVLALVNITTPAEGQAVSGTFTASGVASSFEGTVPWQILDSSGKKVLDGAAQSTVDYKKLTPWQADVDVSSLAPGDYTFVATTDDASGGEGPGPTQDTKAITVS